MLRPSPRVAVLGWPPWWKKDSKRLNELRRSSRPSRKVALHPPVCGRQPNSTTGAGDGVDRAPRLAERLQKTADFRERRIGLLDVAGRQPLAHVVVKPRQVRGDLASGIVIERALQFTNDGNRFRNAPRPGGYVALGKMPPCRLIFENGVLIQDIDQIQRARGKYPALEISALPIHFV